MQINNISFTAVLSPRLLNKIKTEEFKGDENRTEKFSNLFHDTFEKNADDTTEIDVNSENKLVFKNIIFPNVKHETEIELSEDFPAEHLVSTCPKNISYNEFILFQKIIRNENEKGTSFKDLENKVKSQFKNEKMKADFLELINIAKRIKKGDKDAVLDEIAFEYMIQWKMMEEMNDPESPLRKMISSMGLMFDR